MSKEEVLERVKKWIVVCQELGNEDWMAVECFVCSKEEKELYKFCKEIKRAGGLDAYLGRYGYSLKDAGIGVGSDVKKRVIEVKKVRVSDVKVGERLRDVDEGKVEELAESIKEIGLIQPIVVDKGMNLVAGVHRYEAVKRLGWLEVDAVVVDVDEDERVLMEVDENWVRKELTVLERADLLKKVRDVYERKGYGGKRYGIGEIFELSSKIDFSFKNQRVTEILSKKMCVTERYLYFLLAIGERLDEETKNRLKGSWAENSKTVLLGLCDLDIDKRREVVDKILSGEINSAGEFELYLGGVKVKKGDKKVIKKQVNEFEKCLKLVKSLKKAIKGLSAEERERLLGELKDVFTNE